MTSKAYNVYKGLAYPVLATICSCDHPKAQAMGYLDGWQMLLDKHEDNEMALFCLSLGKVMTLAQSTQLLDGLAREYTEFSNWGDFATACSNFPNWKPSSGPAPKVVASP